ncbi:methanogen output domain 1-containing protein [Jiella sp. MQZ9-1]|uniref:Metanogen output domain-containing protein n=1 Tax=Jiella flava TaxID=2816857 RepID=A0A939G064_9HYPH|nr:methanogen output domain 1-containing protein [Jiella flava]MBO0662747.1 hypothetical protein [Jiella flava]MCD2471169.1 methanogen output domain 1-containing protein [Jiella flava]
MHRNGKADRRTIKQLPLDFGRDQFFCRMLRELSNTIEEVVGTDDAAGYVATVGGAIGEWINQLYHAKLGPEDFDLDTLARIFVDLKRRIDGGFYIKQVAADRIVLGNTRCPFGRDVMNRPMFCMMTSNVFGRICADNHGYARVRLSHTIAQGDRECEVIVSLKPHDDRLADEREYYRSPRFDDLI